MGGCALIKATCGTHGRSMASSQLAGDSAVVEWSSYVRGHHVYCQIWTPTIGEILLLQNEPETGSQYQYSVAVVKNAVVVGHVPRPISRIVFHFLNRDGHSGVCEVIGNRLNRGVNLGVEVPCIYRFYGRRSYVDRLNSMLHAT